MKESIFKFISSLFKKNKIQSVLIGGYAFIAYKVQRLTFDIDFIITAADCNKIEPEIIKAGYSIRNRQDAFIQFKAEKQGLRDLDFLITDQRTMELLISEGQEIFIGKAKFIIPSLNHLIEMKLHSIINNKNREFKDLSDIVQLIIANKLNPKSDEIKEIFKKYNLMDLYKNMIKAIGNDHERTR